MGSILECIKSRRSIRNFKPDDVPQDLIDKVVTAGLYAPSAMGRQSCIVVEILNKEVRDQISRLNSSIIGRENTDPFYGAPVILTVFGPKDFPPYIYDGSLIMQNMMLEAHELGLGTCWIHRAKEEFETDEGRELMKAWGIKENFEGIGHLALGFIDGTTPPCHPRKDGRVIVIK